MKDVIIEKIESEMDDLLTEIRQLDKESDEYDVALTKLSQLQKILNDMSKIKLEANKESREFEKMEVETQMKSDAMNMDEYFKEKSIKLEYDKLIASDKIHEEEIRQKEFDRKKMNINSIIDTGVKVTAIIAPLAFYGVWMNRGLEFEKEGVFTSTTFKGLFSKFKTN